MSTSPTDRSGTGSPEGVVSAIVGSSYRQKDGGAGTTWWVKESGSGNTGWVAHATDSAAALRLLDFLVGTATGELSDEIVVGTTPGGELGGTWASPTVDASHSGTTHAGAIATAEGYADTQDVAHVAAADPHVGYVLESLFDAAGDLITASADNTPSKLTKGSTGRFLQAGASALAYAEVWIPVTFSKGGVLATGAGAFRWYNRSGRTLTFDSVTAAVGTAPTGANLIVDVNVDGTTIYTTQGNRPTIAATTNVIDDTTVPDVTTIADNSYITIDVDQVGSTIAGSDLAVTVWLKG
jgi:hypothetical protein